MFKEKVKLELERLEKEGIIEKVETSEWETPLVPVIKTNVSVLLCADYKMNKYLKAINNSLPKMEQLLTAL